MEKITGNEQVYPVQKSKMVKDEGVTSFQTMPGLTIRQHYTGLAMQGLLAGEGWAERIKHEDPDNERSLSKIIARASVIIADQIIAELNNPTPAG